MRHFHSRLALAAAAVFGAATFSFAAAPPEQNANSQAGAQQNQQGQRQATGENEGRNSTNRQSQQAPEGFVIIDEQLITLTANEPQNHFIRAREYLSHNDPGAAAAEVRIAAGYLDMQASRKGESDQQQLRSESQQLRQLADRIGSGNQVQQQTNRQGASAKKSNEKSNATGSQSAEERQLNEEFAKADRTLARHFQERAKSELSQQRAIRAGEDLDAAASALKASMMWTGGQSSKDAMQAITDARRVSEELLTPGGQQGNATAANRQQSERAKSDVATNSNQNNNNDNSNEAQPASARISGDNNQGAAQSQTKIQIPADAQKVVEELGKAIGSADQGTSTGQAGQKQGDQQRTSGTSGK